MAKQKESAIGWREPRWTPDCGYSKAVMMAKIFPWQMSLNSSYWTQSDLYVCAEKIKVDEDIDIELAYYGTKVRVTSHTWDFAKDSAHQLKNGAIISKDSLQETDGRFYFLKDGVFCGGRR